MRAEGAARSPWRWLWLGWFAGVVVSVAASWMAVPLVVWWNGASCNEVATAANRNNGLLGLGGALAVISFPWLVVTLAQKGRRTRLVVGWILGVGLLVAFGLTHLTVQSWEGLTGGFCF